MPYHKTLDKTVTRGDDRKITLICKDDAGDPLDITNYNFWYTAKHAVTDLDDDAVIKIDPGSVSKADSGTGTTDSAIFSLTSTLTDILPRNYVHDIQVETDDNEFKTWFNGTLTIIDGVTVRVT